MIAVARVAHGPNGLKGFFIPTSRFRTLGTNKKRWAKVEPPSDTLEAIDKRK